ncbi:MAG TPA: metalloregulator ArsR/SmtB family transcription factor [Terriglobales bacterium]|nr:metalloregulator ArsR/SmtB family transcription factor [Terriglobales bacterium]
MRKVSEIHKVMSNPRRLEILYVLRGGAKTVGELSAATGFKQANVSQHLALMRHRGVVVENRKGNLVFYRIRDRRITTACDIMRDVLSGQANEDSKLGRLTKRDLTIRP